MAEPVRVDVRDIGTPNPPHPAGRGRRRQCTAHDCRGRLLPQLLPAGSHSRPDARSRSRERCGPCRAWGDRRANRVSDPAGRSAAAGVPADHKLPGGIVETFTLVAMVVVYLLAGLLGQVFVKRA